MLLSFYVKWNMETSQHQKVINDFDEKTLGVRESLRIKCLSFTHSISFNYVILSPKGLLNYF